MSNKNGFFFLFFLSLFACSKAPQPIVYGNDACHFCRMTIVDQIHGAEIISDKGKIFKFDAAECMIRYKNSLKTTEGYEFLTNCFESPTELIFAETAQFLVCEKLPSPMGAFLTAFKSQTTLNQVYKEKGGKAYSWKEINEQFKGK